MSLHETFKKTDTSKSAQILSGCLLLFVLTIANFSFALPVDIIEVSAKNGEAEAATIYTVSFTVAQSIPARAIIRISFPPEFDISDLQVVGSSTINGGFEHRIDNQILTLTRSGLGREIAPNEKADVKFAIVKNPPVAKSDYIFVVEILNEKQESLIRRQQNIKITPKE